MNLPKYFILSYISYQDSLSDSYNDEVSLYIVDHWKRRWYKYKKGVPSPHPSPVLSLWIRVGVPLLRLPSQTPFIQTSTGGMKHQSTTNSICDPWRRNNRITTHYTTTVGCTRMVVLRRRRERYRWECHLKTIEENSHNMDHAQGRCNIQNSYIVQFPSLWHYHLHWRKLSVYLRSSFESYSRLLGRESLFLHHQMEYSTGLDACFPPGGRYHNES